MDMKRVTNNEATAIKTRQVNNNEETLKNTTSRRTTETISRPELKHFMLQSFWL
jgi:hypothetical protein